MTYQPDMFTLVWNHPQMWNKHIYLILVSNFVYETQNLEEMDTHAPGNTYYFIERHKAGTVKKLIWGKESGQPEILYQFHRFLWNQIAILQDQKK